MRGCTCTGSVWCPQCHALAQRAGLIAAVTEAQISERAFMAAVVRLARLQGFLVYHTYNAKRSPEGFMDLVIVHPTRRETPVFCIETKSATGQVTRAQEAWIAALHERRTIAEVWRPADLEMITRWLTGRAWPLGR